MGHQQKLASRNEEISLVTAHPRPTEHAWDENFSNVDDEGQDLSPHIVPSFTHAEQRGKHSSVNKPRLSLPRRQPPQTQSGNTRSSSHDESWLNDLPSPSTLIGRDPTKSTGSQGDANPSHENRLDQRLVAQVHGVKDSIGGKRGEDEFPPDSTEDNLNDQSWEHSVTDNSQREDVIRTPLTSDGKLFLSTDIPEEKVHGAQGQILEQETPTLVQDKASDHERPRKMLKTEHDFHPDPKASITSHDMLAPITPEHSREHDGIIATSPAVLPPTFHRPAWVDSFDPAFIAEWQDIVEFID